MLVDDFNYYLPDELIAQEAHNPRDKSRMLVMDRRSGQVTDGNFTDILRYLGKGDLLVLNDTRVIPARLFGKKKGTGGNAEILLLKERTEDCWESLVRPGARLREGTEIVFQREESFSAKIVKDLGEGLRLIEFSYKGSFNDILSRLGKMPLPPYIHKELEDKERYQTVYGKRPGSAAAPTAGLHFTEEFLFDIKQKGVNVAYVTLHVGLGTFKPVSEKRIENHKMHSEVYQVSRKTWDLVNATKEAGKKVVAVGTTVVRTLEAVQQSGQFSGETAIFIYPGFDFKVIDGLLTNFHLPKSTLLMLVAAFADREALLRAYKHAVSEKYRFFSLGDCMLII